MKDFLVVLLGQAGKGLQRENKRAWISLSLNRPSTVNMFIEFL